MKRISSMLKKYPLEVLLCLAFAGLFIRRPDLAMANLMVLVSLVVSGYLFLSNITLFKNLAPIPLLGSLAVYYFLNHQSYVGLFVAIALISILSIVFLSIRYGINPRQSKITSRILILGMAIVILMPLTYQFGGWLSDRYEVAKLDPIYQEMETNLSKIRDEIKEASPSLEKDPFIWNLYNNKSYSDLTTYLQNLMVSKGMGYLTVTDCQGIVVSRAHQNKMLGDDYNAILPSLKDENKPTALVREGDRVYLATSKKILDANSACLAYLIVGQPVTLSTRGASSFIINGKAANFVGTDQTAVNLLTTLKDRGDLLQNSYIKISDGNKQAIAKKRHLDEYNADQFTAKSANHILAIILVNSIFYFLAGAILYWLLIYYRLDVPVMAKEETGRKIKKHAATVLRVTAEVVAILLITIVLSKSNAKEFIAKGIDVSYEANLRALNEYQPSLALEYTPLSKLGESQRLHLKLQNLPAGTAMVKTSLHYPPEYLEVVDINYADGPCDQVYDKNIDNKSGSVSFSCVLKYTTSSGSNSNLFELVYTSTKIGVAELTIEKSDTSIRTSRGDSDLIEQTFLDGEKILIGN